MLKRRLLIGIILLVITLSGWSQEIAISDQTLPFETPAEQQYWKSGTDKNDPLSLFIAVHAGPDNNTDLWNQLVNDLDKQYRKKGESLNFLRILFQKTHQTLLKKYEQHSTFNDMLSEGKFDCVSGSAALSLLLERYDFQYEIVETDYHVFLVVDTEDKNIILESTLKIGGMITAPSEFQNYLDAYKPTPSQAKKYLPLNQRLGTPKIDYSDNGIFRKVNLIQLAGLQYYNDAILHFNQQRFREASQQLEKAFTLYSSERIEGLKELAIDQAYKTYGTDIGK